jgi:hypothetical protein
MAHDGDDVVVVETIVNRAIMGLTLSIMAANYACLSWVKWDFGNHLALLICWSIQTGLIFSLTIALCCWLGCCIEGVVCRAGAWYYEDACNGSGLCTDNGCDGDGLCVSARCCSGYLIYPLMVTVNLPCYIIEAVILFVHIDDEQVMAQMVSSLDVFWWFVTMAGGLVVAGFLSYVLVHALIVILGFLCRGIVAILSFLGKAIVAIFESCAVALSHCGRAMVRVLINCCLHRGPHVVDEHSVLRTGTTGTTATIDTVE